MPWHPKDVPLVLNLRRNLGRGVVLEGLQVRWHYVSRLLRALCSYAPNGQVWRIGGHEQEPMHKFYDPRMFDMLDESGMRSRHDRTSDIAEFPASPVRKVFRFLVRPKPSPDDRDLGDADHGLDVCS